MSSCGGGGRGSSSSVRRVDRYVARPRFLREFSPKMRESICRSILLRKQSALSKSGYQRGSFTAVEAVRKEASRRCRRQRESQRVIRQQERPKTSHRFNYRKDGDAAQIRRPLSRGVVGMRVCTYVLARCFRSAFVVYHVSHLRRYYRSLQI